MNASSKVTSEHLRRQAYLYVRQSSLHQIRENKESTIRQYDFKHKAETLGWRADQLVVIDEDLGMSGASASNRNGFQRLIADVGLGRVGVVMGLEVSRLARNSTDWHRLLEICALSETLILDEDGLYDPGHFNDRLLLGLKGTMSEAELHILKARLIGGLLNKARRGELWMKPPIGYIYDAQKKLVFDPDVQVQGTVRLLFETFQRTGSAEQVVKHFSKEKISFPRRLQTGPRAKEIIFAPLEHSRVLNILHNPRYAGAYVFGRSRQRKVWLPGQMRHKRLPRSEWKIFLPNTHPGYISWDQFEINQAKLLENAYGYGADRRKSPAREGAALLQGLIVCGICGGRMSVMYSTYKGHPRPTYTCQRRGIQQGKSACQLILGHGLDVAVGKVILESVTPATLDVALQVFEELRVRKEEQDRLRKAQVQRAREEAELAQRQFLLVRPENRLVADTLEKEWNQKLLHLRQVEEEYTKATNTQDVPMAPDQKEQILFLASDLPRVWNDPRTPMRDKKRMLRLLIEDITLIKHPPIIKVNIRWKGGATTSLKQPMPKRWADQVRTPTTLVETIRALATEQTDAQIAQILNSRSLRSGSGKPFHRLLVRSIRLHYHIDGFAQHLQHLGWLTAFEVAAQWGIHFQTAMRLAREGVLKAIRAADNGQVLFEPPTGPCPKLGRISDEQRWYSKLPHKTSTKMIKGVQYAA